MDILNIVSFESNSQIKITTLKGKFHYSLPIKRNFLDFEFSVKTRELSTFTGCISTTSYFFVDSFSFQGWQTRMGHTSSGHFPHFSLRKSRIPLISAVHIAHFPCTDQITSHAALLQVK